MPLAATSSAGNGPCGPGGPDGPGPGSGQGGELSSVQSSRVRGTHRELVFEWISYVGSPRSSESLLFSVVDEDEDGDVSRRSVPAGRLTHHRRRRARRALAIMSSTMRTLAILTAVLVTASCVVAHSYHLGSCPNVEPMPNFDMEKFLGKWYVIQKTSTGSRCLVYNFTHVPEEKGYRIEQISEHLLLGLTSVDHKYRYSGLLRVNEGATTNANLTVRFPLSVAGSASYRVFITDYDTYAAVFTCQRLAFANRQSVSILSRKRVLDKQYIDKIRNRMSTLGVDPFDLSIISQDDCAVESTGGVDINIDEGTFTPQSAAGVVRKAGEKIGDGIEYAADGAKKLYNTVRGKQQSQQGEDDYHGRFSDRDAEWLP